MTNRKNPNRKANTEQTKTNTKKYIGFEDVFYLPDMFADIDTLNQSEIEKQICFLEYYLTSIATEEHIKNHFNVRLETLKTLL